jgi:hypothetical protein
MDIPAKISFACFLAACLGVTSTYASCAVNNSQSPIFIKFDFFLLPISDLDIPSSQESAPADAGVKIMDTISITPARFTLPIGTTVCNDHRQVAGQASWYTDKDQKALGYTQFALRSDGSIIFNGPIETQAVVPETEDGFTFSEPTLWEGESESMWSFIESRETPIPEVYHKHHNRRLPWPVPKNFHKRLDKKLHDTHKTQDAPENK